MGIYNSFERHGLIWLKAFKNGFFLFISCLQYEFNSL